MNRDHGFTQAEQSEYDSLRAAGRTMYDDLRWNHGHGHHDAFCLALAEHGRKRTA